MPKQRRLNQLMVGQIKPSATRQEIPTGTCPGLMLRVSTAGHKSYTLRTRWAGKQLRMQLGDHPKVTLAEATAAANDILDRIGAGLPPIEVPEEAPLTVAQAAEEWVARDQARRRTVKEVERVLAHDVLPALGDKPLADVTKRDLIELLDSIVDRGAPVMASRCRSHLRRFMKWCLEREMMDRDPAATLPALDPVSSRERWLDDAELALVWHALDRIDRPMFAAMIRVLICTGCRRDEVASARWGEIDGDTLKLPAGRVKVEKGRNVPLNHLALQILESLPQRTHNKFVFSLDGERVLGNVGHMKAKLDGELGVMKPWRIHDLRRSVASGLQALGQRVEVIEHALGHLSGTRGGIIGRYQRYSFEPEVRKALDQWGAHIEKVCKIS